MVAPSTTPSQPAATATHDSGPVRFAPAARFVWLVALVIVPLALAELLWAGAEQLLVLAAISIACAALLDATLGLRRARGVTARFPKLARWSLGRAVKLELVVQTSGVHPLRVRIGVASPVLLGVTPEEPWVDLPAGDGALRIEWDARPKRRGVFRPGPVHLECRSPLGLWAVRWMLDVAGEVRVYPNLMNEGRKLAALFMRRSSPGARLQRLVGRGRDFEKLREYLPGDGFDEIHWKATAKRGHLVTKVFQVERTQEIYAVIDASRLSARSADGGGEADDTLLERQINAALSLALAAERQGDLFGLVSYTDLARGFVRAKCGPAHFQACREAVVQLQPEPVSADLREVFTFLRTRLTKRALLVFLVSLDDPALAESFLESVSIISRHHVVIVATPLPRDAVPLFQGEPPAADEGAYARLGGHIRWQGLHDLGARLHRLGVTLALLDRDNLAAGVVSHYMALKQRQQL